MKVWAFDDRESPKFYKARILDMNPPSAEQTEWMVFVSYGLEASDRWIPANEDWIFTKDNTILRNEESRVLQPPHQTKEVKAISKNPI